jgi:hypothetical protein
MSCHLVAPQNGNSPATYHGGELILPKRLNKIHRLHMRIGHAQDAVTSDEFVNLLAVLHEYLAQPEPWRSEYEKKYMGNL